MWLTKLKLCRVILDIGVQSRSVPDFVISSLLFGGCLLKSSNQFRAHSIHPIELELDRMILDISLLNCSKLFFFDFHSKVHCGGVLLAIYNWVHSLQFLCN